MNNKSNLVLVRHSELIGFGCRWFNVHCIQLSKLDIKAHPVAKKKTYEQEFSDIGLENWVSSRDIYNSRLFEIGFVPT